MLQRELYKLFLLTLKFRNAIEKCDKSLLPVSFKHFPAASCKDSSLLLSIYLKENDFGEFYYVLGERGKLSHCWLMQDNVVVDITADQFDDQQNKVIVLANSEWHNLFEGKVQHKASLDIYEGSTKTKLLKAYKTILEYIK